MEPTDPDRPKSFVPPAFSEQPRLDKLRLAVLPLKNISPDPNDGYFADGMTEELISTLSKIGGLKVIARTSVMGYKDAEKKIDEIARELNVGTILEGSVRKAGDKLRITVQLIDADNSGNLWSESYDRDMKDVFIIQSDVSQTVAEALKVKLLPKERDRVERKPTSSVQAYELYLKGLETAPWIVAGYQKENIERSKEYFERAIKLDPDFALAYSGLSLCYTWGYFLFMSYDERLPKAEAAARRALEIDDDLAECHAAFSDVFWAKYDFEGSNREIKRAIELKPNYAFAHMSYGSTCILLGRFDEAQIELRKARELDPLSSLIRTWLISLFYNSRQYDRALEYITEEMKLHESPGLHDRLAEVYLAKRDYAKGLIEAEKAVALAGPDEKPYYTSTLALFYAKTGRQKEANEILKEVEEAYNQRLLPQLDGALAAIHFLLGDSDKTLRILEKAYSEHSVSLLFSLINPFYDELREDPRFIALRKKVGLER